MLHLCSMPVDVLLISLWVILVLNWLVWFWNFVGALQTKCLLMYSLRSFLQDSIIHSSKLAWFWKAVFKLANINDLQPQYVVEITSNMIRVLMGLTIIFFLSGFVSRTFTIHGTAEEGKANTLTPLYYFRPLGRQLNIRQAPCSPLHIPSSWTWTGKLWFPSTNRWPLRYAPLWHLVTPCNNLRHLE